MKQVVGSIWDLTKFALCVIIAAFILKAVVFQPFVVDGYSMEPSFHDREYLIVNKFLYYFKQPTRGEVVIFRPPDHPEATYIKRVIGLPNDTIKIANGNLSVNGNLMQEDYLKTGQKTVINGDEKTTFEITLGKDEFFVMGDNRDHSSDSREFGVVPRKNIVGEAWLTLYPTQYLGFVNTK